MKLTPSQLAQVNTFSVRDKIEALQLVSYPSNMFSSAANFAASMNNKLNEMGENIVLSKKQFNYLNLLFWKYRKQHCKIRMEQSKTELKIERDGQQQDLFHKPRPERMFGKYL